MNLECVKYCVVYDHRTSSLEVLLKHDDDNDEYSDNNGEGRFLYFLPHARNHVQYSTWVNSYSLQNISLRMAI